MSAPPLPKVFIDGEAGTTGLQVRGRLAGRSDLEIISPPDDQRKDPATRRRFLAEADAAILCLPDDGEWPGGWTRKKDRE